MNPSRRNILSTAMATASAWLCGDKAKAEVKPVWRNSLADPPPTAYRASIERLNHHVNGRALLLSIGEASELCVIRKKRPNGLYEYHYATWKESGPGEFGWMPTTNSCFMGPDYEWMDAVVFSGQNKIILLQAWEDEEEPDALNPGCLTHTILDPA